MLFRDDDRAQSIQIGAILLFAVLIILLATYQAFIVPDQNREIEANHAGTITQQMQELRSAIVSVPSTRAGRSVTLTLGTTYPPRAVAINPPTPTGTVRTVGTIDDRANLTVANAVAVDSDVDDAWDGTNRTYNSGGVTYQPGYNEYRNAPDIVYENSLLYHRFGSDTLTRAGQRLVDGRRLSLVTVNGSLDTAASDSVSIDVNAVSASDRRISVTNEVGENVTLDVVSQLSAAQWETELRDTGEFVDQGGHVVDVTESPIPNSPFVVVHVTLERDETYVLRMAKVGVGTGVTQESVAYLTEVRGDGASVPQGQNTTLVVEARDRFNNPVPGVPVNGTVASGTLSAGQIVTDEEGRAAFDYQAPSGTTGRVAANFSYSVVPGAAFDDDAVENVTMGVTVEGSGGVTGSLVYDGNAQAHDGPDDNSAPGGVNITFENTHGSTVTITDVEVKPDDPAIDVLADRVTSSGIASHEFYVAADQSDGYVDFSDLSWTDGTVVPREVNLNSDGRVNNGDPQLSAGSSGTLYLYEFFTDTDDATNVDMSGETLEVVVSYRLATGQAYQAQYTVTPTAGGGGGGGTTDPAIDQFDATETTQNNQAEFDVDWAVSDGEGDLDSVTIEMLDQAGNTVDTASNTVSGGSASGTDTLTESGNPSAQDYEFVLTVTDAAGNTVSDSQDVAYSGN